MCAAIFRMPEIQVPLFDMENNMREYIPLVLFIFSSRYCLQIFMGRLFVYWASRKSVQKLTV